MICRPNSNGLEVLEDILNSNSHRIPEDVLTSLQDAYNTINDETEAMNDFHDNAYDSYDIDSHIEDIKEKVGNILSDIDDIFIFNEHENEIVKNLHEKFEAVKDKFNLDDLDFEHKDSYYNDQLDEIKKMIAVGYKFNSGEGLRLTQEMERKRKEEEEET